MKTFVILLLWLSMPVISIVGMMHGWGLEPENWGWICFSYLFSMGVPIVLKMSEKK